MIQATCHCGAVRLEIAKPPEKVTECNCSICRRYGALWAYYTTADVQVAPTSPPTDTYIWGDRMVLFHRCPTCGNLTHYTSANGDSDRVAVNARMMPLSADDPVPVRRFDGADSWEVVASDAVWPWPVHPLAEASGTSG